MEQDMLGFFGPAYARSDAVTLCGKSIRKQVAPSLTAVQVEMTRRARRLGRQSGLFGVPRVLGCEERTGRVELERLDGLVTLGGMIDRTGDGLDLLRQAGRALAYVHQHLKVPPDLRKAARLGPAGNGAMVGIHGDFNTVNVCYRPGKGDIVILDWACAQPFGPGSTVGSRYLDLSLMLRSLVIHLANVPRAIRRFRPRASALLAGYQEQWQRRLDLGRLGQTLLYVSSLYLRLPTTSNVFWKKWLYGLAALAAHLTFRRAAAQWRRQPRAVEAMADRAHRGSERPASRPSDQLDYRTSHASADKAASYDAGFDRIAFRAFTWSRERRVLDLILRRHYAGRPITHLDFACGTGRILAHLAGRTRSSTGIDVSPGMIELARPKAPYAELIVGDITRQNLLAGRTFNLITAFRFFPNAQPELRLSAMQALRRHLAPDGLLVFNNHRCDSGGLFLLARLLGRRPHTMSLEEVTDLARAGGLEIAEVFPIGTLPATDGHMLVPPWVHGVCDRLAGAVGLSARLAQNIIFVCRPAGLRGGVAEGFRRPAWPAREVVHA
jgi:SAM-dependent methyltransferase